MANRTVKDANSIHGTNPQYLVEKIIRSRIYECKYWKENCFALTAELLVDKAVDLKYIGGVYGGNIKPTPFLCLLLKMLQIQPDKDIVIEFIKQQDYKYVRALGALYLRLVGESVECYKYLEALYNDYRKIKFQDRNGNFSLKYVDDFIDELLHEERVCDIILPRIQKRNVLEENNMLDLRQSLLDEDLEDIHLSEVEEEEINEVDASNQHRGRDQRDRDRHRERLLRDENETRTSRGHRDRERKRSRERETRRRSRSRDRRRSRSRDRRGRSRSRDRDRYRQESPERKRNRRKDYDNYRDGY